MRMERWNNSAMSGVGRGSWLFHLCSIEVEQWNKKVVESDPTAVVES